MIPIYNLLAESLVVKVYPDYVPESADRPAVCYVNITNLHERDMDGNKQAKSSHWRVTIVADTFADLSVIIDALEALDNTSTDEFSKIYSTLELIEPKDEEALYRRAFVDLTIY